MSARGEQHYWSGENGFDSDRAFDFRFGAVLTLFAATLCAAASAARAQTSNVSGSSIKRSGTCQNNRSTTLPCFRSLRGASASASLNISRFKSPTRKYSVFSVTIPNITPSQNTPDLPNMRRGVTTPSGANCSRSNSENSVLASVVNPLAGASSRVRLNPPMQLRRAPTQSPNAARRLSSAT